MSGWETRIATGNPDTDRATIEQHRQSAAAQGLDFTAVPHPSGGYQVRAFPRGGMGGAPSGYGAPSSNYGAGPQTVPSSGPGPSYGAPQAYSAPQGYGAPQGGYGGSPSSPGPAPSGGAMAFAGAAAAPGYAGVVVGGPSAQSGGGFAGLQSLGAERVAYLRKVYGLLAAACFVAIFSGYLALHVGAKTMVSVGSMHKSVSPVVGMMINNPGVWYGAFVVLFLGTMAASAVSRVKGVNLVALMLVSALMGLEVAPMVFVAQFRASMGHTLTTAPVDDAFALVGAVFVSITAYVFVTRKDFSYLAATLSMGFGVIFVASILAIATHSNVLQLAVASAGSLLAAGFLLYQTSRIFRDSAMDDPVGDALSLIVQLRTLFVFILRIFMSRR